ncbi:tetratricopeptide repeat protein [Candidatus Oleimmundimicrobium sp.]|uniref:tetratricopeptide repeat protein n=1 Tax=Candidatus Oleimmundimicrobium sp. TaxID=3060597 RepID=UPI002718587E|nr:tetratricopeptide repeat protein [Candidatus Oleimmundimicrobium sp.]MDO8886621.1 tetratricopeptide repeat protein [Candidatus Oleimmundimicrobium sp.]
MIDKTKVSLINKLIALGIAVLFIASFLGGFAYLVNSPQQTQNSVDPQELNFQNEAAQIGAYLEENPKDVQAWAELGNTYYDRGAQTEDLNMFAAAIDAYRRALELDPNQNDARTDMALAYLFMGSTEKAIAELKKVLENDPNHVNAILDLGYANKVAGNLSEAVKFWEKFLEIAPQDHPKRADVEKGLEEIKKEISKTEKDTTELESGR